MQAAGPAHALQPAGREMLLGARCHTEEVDPQLIGIVRGAVDRDERTRPERARRHMKRARHGLAARAGIAAHQHARPREGGGRNA